MRPAGIPKSSGILPRWIFAFLWVFHKLGFTPLQVLERVSFLRSTFLRKLSLVDRPLSVARCMIIILQRRQNLIAGEGRGHLCAIHYPAPYPATKCPLFHKLKSGHPIKTLLSSCITCRSDQNAIHNCGKFNIASSYMCKTMFGKDEYVKKLKSIPMLLMNWQLM